jgi:hypothetical protein
MVNVGGIIVGCCGILHCTVGFYVAFYLYQGRERRQEHSGGRVCRGVDRQGSLYVMNRVRRSLVTSFTEYSRASMLGLNPSSLWFQTDVFGYKNTYLCSLLRYSCHQTGWCLKKFPCVMFNSE